MQFSRDAALSRVPAPHLLKQEQLQLVLAFVTCPIAPPSHMHGELDGFVTRILRGQWVDGPHLKEVLYPTAKKNIQTAKHLATNKACRQSATAS